MSTTPDVPPHDLDLEREVLGWTLMTGRIDDLRGRDVTRDAFYRHAHQLVWDAALAVQAAGGRVSRMAVSTELRARKHLEEVGPAYVLSLSDGVTDGPLGYQIDTLLGLQQRRALLRRLASFQSALSSEVDDETLETHLDLLTEVAASRHARGEWLDARQQWATLDREARADKRGRVPLGLPAIDREMEGIAPGEVLGLMARPSIGKTIVLCHVAARSVESGRTVLMFSLEMPAAQIVARIAGMHYRTRSSHIWEQTRTGTLSGDRWAEEMARLHVCDREGLTVSEMSSLIAQASRLHGQPALVVVDHLGLIGGDRRLSTYDRVSTQSRELKGLAKRHHCAVLLAVQVSREAGGLHGEKALSLGAARDSGVVEEATDYMIGLRRVDKIPNFPEGQEYRDILWLQIHKHRHGSVTQFEHAYHMEENGLWLQEQAACPVPHIPGDAAAFGSRGRR